MKVPVTIRSPFMTTRHGDVPTQLGSDQPVKVEPGAGVALRKMAWP